MGQRVFCHELVVRLVRAIGHAHGVRAAPDALDQHARIAFAAGFFQLRQPFFGAQDHRCRAVAHHADIQAGQRPGDHRRVAHILNRVAVAFLRVGIVIGVDVILHRDVRQLLDRRAELFHVARDHHRVVAGVKAADRIIEAHIRGQRDELVAFPGVRRGSWSRSRTRRRHPCSRWRRFSTPPENRCRPSRRRPPRGARALGHSPR